MTRPLALAISPHLDDAAFSAGGTLAGLARAGWRVVVATVFTRSVPNPQGFALACQLDKGLAADIDYMARRRAEDASACRHLGAEPHWLPFPEAPHRGYASAPALFAGLRADDGIVAAITPALGALLAGLAPAMVLGPQAIGGHVDHVAVVDALAALALPAAVRWWRDDPYVERDGSVPAPRAARFEALSEVVVTLDEASRAAKTEAALAYASQVGFQFGGAARARARFSAQTAESFASAARTEGQEPTRRPAPIVSA